MSIGEYHGPKLADAFFRYVDARTRRMVTDYTWYSYIALQIRLRGEGKYSKQEWKPTLNEIAQRKPVHKPGSVIEYLKQSGAIGVVDE